MTIRAVYEEFAPAERAAMSGLSQIARRRLEDRGYIKKSEGGWSRVPVHAVAVDQVFFVLGALGLRPATIRDIAHGAAQAIALHALRAPGAVADPGGLNKLNEPVVHTHPYFYDMNRFMIAGPEVRTMASRPELGLAGVVLNLEFLGQELAAKAPRPLARWVKDA